MTKENEFKEQINQMVKKIAGTKPPVKSSYKKPTSDDYIFFSEEEINKIRENRLKKIANFKFN